MEMYQGCPNTNLKNLFTSSHKFHTGRLQAALKMSLNLLRKKCIQITLKNGSNFKKHTALYSFWETIAVYCANDTENTSCVKNADLLNVKALVPTITRCALRGLLKLTRHDLITSQDETNFRRECANFPLFGNQLF